MRQINFFILYILILGLSSYTVSAKVIPHCLEKKYSQLKEINHLSTRKSCHSETKNVADNVADICFNCDCYFTQTNTIQTQNFLNLLINNLFSNNFTLKFDSISSKLNHPPPELFF